MPSGPFHHDGYDPVGLQHPDMERPAVRQTLSTDTAISTLHGDYSATAPLVASTSYPPLPFHPSKHIGMSSETVYRSRPEYDAEQARGLDGLPRTTSRNSSWDILDGIKKFKHEYEEFDPKNASETHLAFADGDIPKNKFLRLYNYLLNVSIVTRWLIFIVPILSILWIPGILSLTRFPEAKLWGVRLLWWSIWFSVAWVGWWASLAVARIGPVVLRRTVGLVAVATRRYIDWFAALDRYVALFIWCLATWISFSPLIINQQNKNVNDRSPVISLIAKMLFGFFLCAAVLLFEKFSIQLIAGKFHERSYADRIAEQKFAVKVLVTLYRNSSDIPGRSDTLGPAHGTKTPTLDARHFLKQALKGVRVAATTTTTVFGNVASEIAGSSVLQPNSPQAVVQTALESTNKSRLLARRLFYSFAKPEDTSLFINDIAKFFPTHETAQAAFALFDKDSNGDVTRDELEMACTELHREQLSIEHSLRDMDSAVGRLDNLLMSVYVVIAALIIAVTLEAQLLTLVTGAGTLILGLSWLIGGSLQEVLTSIIFLFIKHPFDVGDRINILKESYTVKEIRLLSTVFVDSQGCFVQAPNVVLNTTYIQNIRRSSQMSESFPFDVDYGTTFEQLEALRDKMLIFLKAERRDFLPSFDVVVVDFPGQEKMTLTADIKYKSNWQQGPLKSQRRNKWICALKAALADAKIFGPKGNPKAIAAPDRYTLVPWDEVQANERNALQADSAESGAQKMPAGGWKLSDKNTPIAGDTGNVFGESDELHMTNPRRALETPGLRQRAAAATSTIPAAGTTQPLNSTVLAAEAIEMMPRSEPTA